MRELDMQQTPCWPLFFCSICTCM